MYMHVETIVHIVYYSRVGAEERGRGRELRTKPILKNIIIIIYLIFIYYSTV